MIDKSDLNSLSKFVSEFVDEQVLEVTQKVTLDVHTNLVTGSPVDSGTFRGAWEVETPQSPYDDGTIENATEYAVELMNGHSKQAPSGWVDDAIEAATRL